MIHTYGSKLSSLKWWKNRWYKVAAVANGNDVIRSFVPSQIARYFDILSLLTPTNNHVLFGAQSLIVVSTKVTSMLVIAFLSWYFYIRCTFGLLRFLYLVQHKHHMIHSQESVYMHYHHTPDINASPQGETITWNNHTTILSQRFIVIQVSHVNKEQHDDDDDEDHNRY